MPVNSAKSTLLEPRIMDDPGQLWLFNEPTTKDEHMTQLCPEWHGLVEEFLGESDDLYPGITSWWKRKVVPDLATQRRMCRIVAIDGRIAAVAIARIGTRSSKLCTLRVGEDFRRLGIGQKLLNSTLARLLETGTRKIHFTISERVFDQCGQFFVPYGFRLGAWKNGWYVKGMYELAYYAHAATVRDAIDGQMNLFSNPVVVLSVRPRHVDSIARGQKLVEFRRKFSEKHRSCPALLYSTSPDQCFRLQVSIADVVQSSPDSLWRQFGGFAGCSRPEFDAYFKGAQSGYALLLTQVRELNRKLSLRAPELQVTGFRPPQSFAILPANSPVVAAATA